MRGVHRERRLADPRGPLDPPDPAVAVEEPAELLVAAGEVAGVARQVVAPVVPRALQNIPVELLQLLARLDAELVDEDLARLPEHPHRVGPAPRPRERGHELAPEAPRQRVLGDEDAERVDELGVPPQRELHLDPRLRRRQPLHVQRLREHDRRPAPELQGLLQLAGLDLEVVLVRRLRHPPAEQVQVDLLRLGVEHVARGPVLDGQPGAAQAADVHLQRLAGLRRRLLAPDEIDEPLDGHDPPALDRQDR